MCFAACSVQRGGRTTYFGPLGVESSLLVAYLQAVPGERDSLLDITYDRGTSPEY